MSVRLACILLCFRTLRGLECDEVVMGEVDRTQMVEWGGGVFLKICEMTRNRPGVERGGGSRKR